MNLLCDENMGDGIIDWLRQEGHDVFWARESARGASDVTLLDRAILERRVVLTYDLDLAEEVVRRAHEAIGLVQLRFKREPSTVRLAAFVQHWPQVERYCVGHVVTVKINDIRIRPLSKSS